MNGFKNSCFLLAELFFIPNDAAAREKIYLVPPVQLLPLKKMETNAYGLIIGAKNDVLNENLWQNATYPAIADKFSKTRGKLPPAAENLRLKLLLTAGAPPLGTTGQSFITLKLRQLFDLGYFDEVYKLIQKIPEQTRSGEQNKIYADVLLLQDMQTACFLTDKESEEPFWQRLSAVCAAFNQEEDKAFLSLDLLKEQNGEDAFITNAVDHFTEGKPLTAVPEKVTPFTAAVWRKAGRSLAEIKDKTEDVWFKKLFAQDESIPAEQRLAAAEQLVQRGLLAPTKLRTYYQQVMFDDAPDEKNMAGEKLRALMLQKAAALSSMTEDNIQKQTFLKQGLQSAGQDGLSYAFASAAKDVLETLKPDIDTLSESGTLIEAFALAGLNEQAGEWRQKAEIIFPVSQTAAEGWYFAELTEPDKDRHLFIPALEAMMAYAEKKQEANEAFIRKIDRLMLMFKTLGMIQADETWHYTSFAEGSEESFIAARQTNPAAVQITGKPAGDTVLEALNALDGSYTGLLRALSLLTAAGLEREAAETALQSADIVLAPENSDE